MQLPDSILRCSGVRASLLRWALAIFLVLPLGVSAKGLGERVSAPAGGFSLRPPAEWKVRLVKEPNLIAAIGPDGVNFQAREIVNAHLAYTLADFVKGSLEALGEMTGFKKLETISFTTKSGLVGVETIFEHTTESGERVRQAIFFFQGRPGFKFFATFGASASSDTKALRSLFEEIAGTIQLEK